MRQIDSTYLREEEYRVWWETEQSRKWAEELESLLQPVKKP